MEKKCYEIAGLRILIQSEFQTKDSPVTAPFLVEADQGDVSCVLMSAQVVPEPKGTLCHEEDMMTVWMDGPVTYRSFLTNGPDRRRFMLSEAVPGEEIRVWVLKSELFWAAQIGYIWLAVGLNGLLLQRGRLVLHSSVVQTETGAVLFTATSGTGKSTQADLWAKHQGARIINGDRCALGIVDGTPYVFGVPMAGTSGISENRTVPLCAIVSLSQAPENRIHQLRGARALLEVGFCAVIDRWNEEQNIRAMDLLSRIMESTPAYHLACRPDRGAVETLKKAMEERL